MGVDGIDKADIFDEYFDDDRPKITNFEKIKAMDIDEMAEFLKSEEEMYDSDRLPMSGVDILDIKQWLESEVRE